MPFVEGELCLVKATPPGHDGHGCQGKCGGRLHGVCGRVAEDNELHRICSKCSAKAGKRKAVAPEGAGTGQSKRQKTKEGSKSAPRKRLTTHQKLEILDLLEQRVAHEQTADHFGCAEEEEEKEEDDGDESTGRGRDAPPAYAELSSHFGVLERASEESGNRDAAFYLSKGRMAMIAVHAAKRTRQVDLREFVATELAGTEWGGGYREGYIKVGCFPAVFLPFSPYRLCPSIATGVVFGFLHVALFSRSFFFSLSLATSKEGKRRRGSFFSFIPFDRVLFWLCKVNYIFLPSKVHRVHGCFRFAVGESFRQQQLFRV